MIKVASFDVFDTLLCRLVDRPTDVFSLMEVEFGEGFARARVEAEAAARRGREEVTLDDIYRHIARSLGYDCQRTEQAMAAEIDFERRLCVAREDIVEIMEAQRAAGVRVIAISDMYLPANVVTDLLAARGITPDAVYVSSTYGLTKHTGRLFDKVQDIEGIDVQSWIHHGDNLHADVSVPLSKGIEAIHTPIRSSELHLTPNGANSIAGSIARGIERASAYSRTACGRRDGLWFDVGARHTGLVATQLCAEARAVADATGSSHIFFLARDGMVMKKVFDILYPNDPRIVSYIAASRRMINFPLRCSEKPDYEFLGAAAGGLTLSRLLARVGIDAKIDEDVVALDDAHARALLKPYEEAIKAAARGERVHLEAYLQHVGMASAENAVIVDVGWNCSIQKSLSDFLTRSGKRVNIHGVYIGSNLKATPDLDVRGLYFCGGEPSRDAKSIMSSVEVMELLFTSPESTIVTVKKTDVSFDIVRSHYKEELTKQRAASRIIAGAEAFARHVSSADLLNFLVTDEARRSALDDYRTLVLTPSRALATCAASISHSVGISGSEQRPLAYVGLHWNRPFDLVRSYDESFWKGATAVHLGRIERILASPFGQLTFKILRRLPLSLRTPLKRMVLRSYRNR